jgi:hypothetical protein
MKLENIAMRIIIVCLLIIAVILTASLPFQLYNLIKNW